MTENDLRLASRRSCYWMPDYAWLSTLKPQPGRVMSMSAPVVQSSSDSADQSAAAAALVQVTFGLNSLVAGSFIGPSANQVFLLESVSAGITARDASAKLQIIQMFLFNNGTKFSQFFNSIVPQPMPFTFPAFSGYSAWISGILAMPLMYGAPVNTMDVSLRTLLVNTDGAGAHTYRRSLSVAYRIIGNVDLTSGPSLPGAGMSPEFQ